MDTQGKLMVVEKDGKKTLYDCGKKIEPQVLAKVEGYRLPLDCEWEWAAKGGEHSRKYKFVGSDRVDEVRSNLFLRLLPLLQQNCGHAVDSPRI
jgi:hypothetical protein